MTADLAVASSEYISPSFRRPYGQCPISGQAWVREGKGSIRFTHPNPLLLAECRFRACDAGTRAHGLQRFGGGAARLGVIDQDVVPI